MTKHFIPALACATMIMAGCTMQRQQEQVSMLYSCRNSSVYRLRYAYQRRGKNVLPQSSKQKTERI